MPFTSPVATGQAFNIFDKKAVLAEALQILKGELIIQKLLMNDNAIDPEAKRQYDGTDTIYIKKPVQFTGFDRTLGSTNVINQVQRPTIDSTKLVLNIFRGIGAKWDELDEAITNSAYRSQYVRDLATSLKIDMEQVIMALIASDPDVPLANTKTLANLGATAWNYEALVKIRNLMDSTKIGKGRQINLVLDFNNYNNLLLDEKVLRLQATLPNASAAGLDQGIVLPTVGINVYKSTYMPVNGTSDSISGSGGQTTNFLFTDQTILMSSRMLKEHAGTDQGSVSVGGTDEDPQMIAARYTIDYNARTGDTVLFYDYLMGLKVHEPATLFYIY